MVTSGAIGNGNFGTHAQALFATRSATFHYQGEENFQGKKAIRFDYNVPQMLSGYRIRVSDRKRDRRLSRFVLRRSGDATIWSASKWWPTTFLPELLLASAADKIDYAVARIGEGDFLLPAQSELTMVGFNGRRRAQSREVHLLPPVLRRIRGDLWRRTRRRSLTPRRFPRANSIFPKGSDVGLVLAKEIDLQNAAIGDPLYARVES